MAEALTRDEPGKVLGALLVTIPDAARILAVGRSTIYELIGSSELATVHIGRSVRVPVDELRRFVAQRSLEGCEAAAAPTATTAARQRARSPLQGALHGIGGDAAGFVE
jgi:excisionase family DNA binding protein